MVRLEYPFTNDTLFKALFVKVETEEDLARIEKLGVPIMNQTIETYRSVAASAEFQELERMRSKARHDEAQALHHARQKGLQEGEHKGMVNVARNALKKHMPIEDIMDITGLTRTEIEKLRNSNN
jgi:predicted transposase/invertase (TIGR01784 family)